MAERRFIFFDVGNTLLFPNRKKMLSPIANAQHPSLEQWRALERLTKKEFDQSVQSGRVDHGFWWMFHRHLLDGIASDARHGDGVGNDGVRQALLQELVANTQNSANWDQILPGTRGSLDRIAAKFRIAVISNADGRIEQVLARCGIADCFESITDSGIVGVEKPRQEIFAAALESMNTRADESLYVGDVYSVDYLGARNAGMEAVLLDAAGAYRDREVARVESLEQLEIWLR
ncbi:MAG: HAD family hydrolase [Candidatus Sulfotelmatobacter sp.]|jgi:HAD superfamily hydrolase (TIGR01549 family)